MADLAFYNKEAYLEEVLTVDGIWQTDSDGENKVTYFRQCKSQ